MLTFDQFGLKEELIEAVQALGFVSPSPIQAQAIPLLLSQTTDITALAQTGTGKTAAFGLPLLHKIDTTSNAVQALILSPTRELCMQIQEELVKYSKFLKNVKSVAVYGGTPIGGQIRDLKRATHIIVATPGRLIDLIDRGVVDLESVTTVVLDEADEMLNMGFRDDIDTILKDTTNREQTWLFSATMNNDVRRIAKRYMKSPVEVAVAKENIGNANIEHQYFVTNAHQRFDVLKRLLDFAPEIYGIIFTRTKQDAQEISEKLMREGYDVSPLHGDMDQKMRTKVMDRFKKRHLQAIVATDVAARGIDVSDITHVINYELPDDTEVYTHRSGRTARAGKSGICMSIVTPREIGKIRQIERIVKSSIARTDIPEATNIVAKRLSYFLEKVSAAQPNPNFEANYKSLLEEKLGEFSKEELIDKLVYLQLENTINAYENAPSLNASVNVRSKEGIGKSTDSVRLFINLGTKDGVTTGNLVGFVAESTDLDSKLFNRVTVRELSSFVNVPSDAADYIIQNLSQQKFKSRRVRVEKADAKPGFKDNKDQKERISSGRSANGSRSDRPERSERFRSSKDGYRGGDSGKKYAKSETATRKPKKEYHPENHIFRDDLSF